MVSLHPTTTPWTAIQNNGSLDTTCKKVSMDPNVSCLSWLGSGTRTQRWSEGTVFMLRSSESNKDASESHTREVAINSLH